MMIIRLLNYWFQHDAYLPHSKIQDAAWNIKGIFNDFENSYDCAAMVNMEQYPASFFLIFFFMTELKTPLYDTHVNHQAKIVPFGGWLMPLHYGSQLQEHLDVRTHAGMFDVSHMTIVDVHGEKARQFLQFVIANDVAKLEKSGVGKALYSVMLNPDAGIIDDLIVYLMPHGYRLVVNAATRAKDLAWLEQQAQPYHVHLQERKDLAIIAVQGPEALRLVKTVKPEWTAHIDNLKTFQAFLDHEWLIARTGYTGEDGLEIMCPQQQAPIFWEQLFAAGVKPAGLGARDTLRLEAGMNLYGHDLDDNTHPHESGLAWTIDVSDHERHFCGKEKLLEKIASGLNYKQVGLILEDKGVLREGLKVINHAGQTGVITSGTFSPTLKCSIAIARVPVNTTDTVQVELRGELKPARVVKLPFVRLGKKVFQ
jgi:aminomethyltransferase